MAEIPSPPGVPMGERVPWLRAAMAGTWTGARAALHGYRDAVAARIAAIDADTVVVSHFVAINAVIGACIGDDRVVIRSLDNTSVTMVESTPDGLVLVEVGDEADTLIAGDRQRHARLAPPVAWVLIASTPPPACGPWPPSSARCCGGDRCGP